MDGEEMSVHKRANTEKHFRGINTKMGHQTAHLLGQAEEVGFEVAYYCECSDEACLERIDMDRRKYNQTHLDPLRFVVIPGHEQLDIERIVREDDGYNIIEKIRV